MANVEVLLKRAGDAKRESPRTEFKEQFNPGIDTEWLEVLKDIVAMANSGGGVVIFGICNNGAPSAADVQPVLDLDGATIADKVRRYTGSNFDAFEVHEIQQEDGHHACAIVVHEVESAPLVFIQSGNYVDAQRRQKSAFVLGAVYVRHGAKSEPATTADIQDFIDSALERIRDEWLGNIREVMEAPPGARLAVVTTDEEDEEGRPRTIRLTTDDAAPLYGMLSPDETHPHRQTELIARVNEVLPQGVTINPHDVLSVRRAHDIDPTTHPEFAHQLRYGGSPQYSDAFVDWIAEQYALDDQFFEKTRQRYYDILHP
jgi:hypothetical protein